MHGGGLSCKSGTLYTVEIPHGLRGTRGHQHKAGDRGDLHFADVCPEFTVAPSNNSNFERTLIIMAIPYTALAWVV